MAGVRMVCLWPGLAGAWYRGLNLSLAISLLSAWGLCLLLLATWVWPEWLALWLVRTAWLVAIALWLGASFISHFQYSRLIQGPTAGHSAAFEQAQREYLRGNWFEAEAKLLELIHGQPRDAEALLLLSGVLRKTRRWKSALRRLREIELLDTGSRWAFEIAQEKKWIEREMSGPSQPEDSQESLALEARDTAILESGQEVQISPSSGPQESGQLISQ